MDRKQLGKTKMFVNPVGLGCMGLSHAYGTAVSENDAVDFIRYAYSIGYDFFDTAEVYTGVTATNSLSNNELLVGKAIGEFRENVVVASKFGVEHKGNHLITDSKPETIRKSVEGSLERLQIDCIDLYYQHRIDSKVAPETVAEVMADLIDEGLIKSWGISEVNEQYLRRAHDVCPVTAIQNRYSMLARAHENLFPVCDELDITFVAFSPMANGFLTGAYTKDSKFEESDFRSFMPQYTKHGFESAKELMVLMDNLAHEKDATMAQISLAWMMCKKDFIIPIPGTTKIKNLESNYGACEVKLDLAEINEIDSLLSEIDVPVFGGHSSR